MSSVSLIIAGLGAVVAAIGSGVLLARCFRGPRADLVLWSVALIGLLISLGSQTLGYLVGYDSAMFRAMELGAQVIAPLALIMALSEVAGRSLAARFCARVYIPAVAIVAAVVLTLDQLATTAFTKAWPDPATFYEAPPKYVLMFAIGPLTVLITIIAVIAVVRRSSKPGWNAVLPAQLAAGVAALLLAYPALVLLVKFGAGINLPVHSEFSLVCAAAAGLVWYAGVRTGRLRISVLHGSGAGTGGSGAAAAAGWDSDERWDGADAGGPGGRDGTGRRVDAGPQRGRDRSAEAGSWDGYDPPHELDQTGDIDRYGPGGEHGAYRGGGPYRPERADDGARVQALDHDDDGYGWQTSNDRYGGRGEPGGGLGEDDGEFATGDYDLGHDAAGYASGPPHDWQDGDARPGRYDPESGRYDPAGGALAGGGMAAAGMAGAGMAGAGMAAAGMAAAGIAGAGVAGEDPSRADLFGQIAIYTLLEDRVYEFDQLTERVVEMVRAREPDTLVFNVHAVPSAPMQRILYEVYRDREAYERHRQQPYITHFEADRRPYVLATNVIELGLQQAKVSPFPSVSELFGEPGYDTSGFERPDYLRDYGRPPASQDGPSRAW